MKKKKGEKEDVLKVPEYLGLDVGINARFLREGKLREEKRREYMESLKKGKKLGFRRRKEKRENNSPAKNPSDK